MSKRSSLYAEAKKLRKIGSTASGSFSFDPSCPPGPVFDEFGRESCNLGNKGLLMLMDAVPHATDTEIERILDHGSSAAFRDWLDLFEYLVTKTLPQKDRPDLRGLLASEFRRNEVTYRSIGVAPPTLPSLPR